VRNRIPRPFTVFLYSVSYQENGIDEGLEASILRQEDALPVKDLAKL
jgi:hypothetical protein